MSNRSRRSLLYMPASNASALEKARNLPADCLILDLEDAVAPEKKALAREQALAAIAVGGYAGRELILRVNGSDTPWGDDDLRAAARSGADGVLLPKVNSPDDVKRAVEQLEMAGAATDLGVWIMAETARCILAIDAIARASPRLRGIVVGTNDLGRELQLRVTPDRAAFLTSLGLCVLGGRAHGLAVIDGVFGDLNDDSGLLRECEQGRDLGFDGKTLIHPRQLAAANAAFKPSDRDIERSRNIVTAWEAAASRGDGVCVLDGKLVEKLHAREAQRQLDLAAAIAEMGW
jgi:citrate lyase subunit beta/citryl-CoA lyase